MYPWVDLPCGSRFFPGIQEEKEEHQVPVLPEFPDLLQKEEQFQLGILRMMLTWGISWGTTKGNEACELLRHLCDGVLPPIPRKIWWTYRSGLGQRGSERYLIHLKSKIIFGTFPTILEAENRKNTWTWKRISASVPHAPGGTMLKRQPTHQSQPIHKEADEKVPPGERRAKRMEASKTRQFKRTVVTKRMAGTRDRKQKNRDLWSTMLSSDMFSKWHWIDNTKMPNKIPRHGTLGL